MKDSGWLVAPFYEGIDLSALTAHAIEEFPTANVPADYALVVKARLLGVVEAEKLEVGAENVLDKAKRTPKAQRESSGKAWLLCPRSNATVYRTKSAMGKGQ